MPSFEILNDLEFYTKKRLKTCDKIICQFLLVQKTTAPKSRTERKRKKKKKEVAKKIDGLDILDMHTQNKLVEMDRERKNIYNFDVSHLSLFIFVSLFFISFFFA